MREVVCKPGGLRSEAGNVFLYFSDMQILNGRNRSQTVTSLIHNFCGDSLVVLPSMRTTVCQ